MPRCQNLPAAPVDAWGVMAGCAARTPLELAVYAQAVAAAPAPRQRLERLRKVVIQRRARDQRRVRIVWQGGATTTRDRVTTVGALADRSAGAARERLVVEWTQTGMEDGAIAQALPRRGLRSPQRPQGLASTVRGSRLRHR